MCPYELPIGEFDKTEKKILPHLFGSSLFKYYDIGFIGFEIICKIFENVSAWKNRNESDDDIVLVRKHFSVQNRFRQLICLCICFR